MGTVRVFVSFDTRNDVELYQKLLRQTKSSVSSFSIAGSSSSSTSISSSDEVSEQATRELIQAADQVIIICSEQTSTCVAVSRELQIAQEEKTPYLLLWGRREGMCSKPVGSDSRDAIYSWTRHILQDHIAELARKAQSDAVHSAARLRRQTRQPA